MSPANSAGDAEGCGDAEDARDAGRETELAYPTGAESVARRRASASRTPETTDS